jgi:hypothetical protein
MLFSKKRVKHWDNRHVNMYVVFKQLINRQHKGYNLLADEQQFVADFISLRNLYNKS